MHHPTKVASHHGFLAIYYPSLFEFKMTAVHFFLLYILNIESFSTIFYRTTYLCVERKKNQNDKIRKQI